MRKTKEIRCIISRTPWATDLKGSDNSNDLIWKPKFIFQPPPPIFGYHSNVQSWRMFLKNTFRQFSCKSSRELDGFFCVFHEECPKCMGSGQLHDCVMKRWRLFDRGQGWFHPGKERACLPHPTTTPPPLIFACLNTGAKVVRIREATNNCYCFQSLAF